MMLKLRPEFEPKAARCPTCGCPVDNMFDHLDGCPPEPAQGYPSATYSAYAFADDGDPHYIPVEV